MPDATILFRVALLNQIIMCFGLGFLSNVAVNGPLVKFRMRRWMDMLGRVPLAGYDYLFRQDLAGWSGTQTPSSYALAGDPGLITRPISYSWFSC